MRNLGLVGKFFKILNYVFPFKNLNKFDLEIWFAVNFNQLCSLYPPLWTTEQVLHFKHKISMECVHKVEDNKKYLM